MFLFYCSSKVFYVYILLADCFKWPDAPASEDNRCGSEAELQTYFYSIEEKACVDTSFGGCNVTRNAFLTKEDCEKIAGPICKDIINVTSTKQ